jgi:hypothetical protein
MHLFYGMSMKQFFVAYLFTSEVLVRVVVMCFKFYIYYKI